MSEFLEFVRSIPWYVWLTLVVLFFILFGDKKEWRYSITFKKIEGVGFGDIDIYKNTRTQARIEVELQLNDKYKNKPVEIYINKQLVLTVPKEENVGRDFDYEPIYEHEPPVDGSGIEVVIEGEAILSGKLELM